jgi:hypothetical protein
VPRPTLPPPFNPHRTCEQGLFAFLEGNVTNQLRRVYPVRPERADAWLGGEIARAARDPGALGVFRCGRRAEPAPSWLSTCAVEQTMCIGPPLARTQ